MDTTLYIQLSLLFSFQFAIWGAWCPVLAARLLGPLRMSGKQTGWIYATLPLASFVSPLIAGQLADQYVDPKWLMAGCHVLGAIFLFIAAKTDKFGPLFLVMLVFSFFFGATLALVNTIVLAHTNDTTSPMIFIWAPIAWAAIGYALTGWRSMRKVEGDGSDCLLLGAGLSVIMVLICVIQPATEPKGGGGALDALSMLKEPVFLAFVIAQFIGAAMMQFYFLGTAQFMQDKGIKSKFVPGAMAIAQVAQAVATFFLLGWLYNEVAGATGTMAIGAACWLAMFVVYVLLANAAVIAGSQALHGLAYVFFIMGGWMFVRAYADEKIFASAQALIILVQNGVGLFLGTQIAGFVMDRNSVEGKFQWKKIFVVPVACMIVVVALLLAGVKDPPKKAPAKTPDKPAAEAKAPDAADQPPVETPDAEKK